MIIRDYEISLRPVRCQTICPVIPGRFVASGNCKTACPHFRGMIEDTRGGYLKGKIFCGSDEKKGGAE